MAHPESRRRRLRVKIVAGFARAGKSTVIQRLLGERAAPAADLLGSDERYSHLVAQLAFASACGEASAPLQSVAHEIRRLSASDEVDSLIVELPPGAGLAPILEAFGGDGGAGGELSELAELEAVVVVIDGQRFFEDYTSTDTLAARGLALDVADRRHVAQVLAEQIEAADNLIVAKADRASSGELLLLEDTLRQLNLCASLQRYPSGGFRLHGGSPSARLAPRPLSGPGLSSSGVSSFVYRARRPFHPERLRQQLQREWRGVLRSRGVFWLATRMSEVGSWSQAGPVWEITRAGHWWASFPRETWAGSARLSAEIEEHWQEPFGDRRQELRFVGWDMDPAELIAGFERCLLTDDELARGPEAWAQFPDPFARWPDLGSRLEERVSATLH